MLTAHLRDMRDDFKAITEGAEVRVLNRSVSGFPAIDESAAQVGVYVVTATVEGAVGDDPAHRSYVLLDRPGRSAGGAYWAYPEDLEKEIAEEIPEPAEQVGDAPVETLGRLRVVGELVVSAEVGAPFLLSGVSSSGRHVEVWAAITSVLGGAG